MLYPVTPPPRGTKRHAPSRRESAEPLLSRAPCFGDSLSPNSATTCTGEADPSQMSEYLADVGTALEGVMAAFATPRHSPSRSNKEQPSARTTKIAPFLLFEQGAPVPPPPSPSRKAKAASRMHTLGQTTKARIQAKAQECSATFTRPWKRIVSSSSIPTPSQTPLVPCRRWNTTSALHGTRRTQETPPESWVDTRRQRRRHVSASPKKSPARSSAEAKARIMKDAALPKTVRVLGPPFPLNI